MPTEPELLWLTDVVAPTWVDELPVRNRRLEHVEQGDAAEPLAVVVDGEADLQRHRLSGRPIAILLTGSQSSVPAILEAWPDVPLVRVLELPGTAMLAVGTTAPARLVSMIEECHSAQTLDLEHLDFLERMIELAPQALRTIRDATGTSFADLADLARDRPHASVTDGVKLDPDVLDELWDLTARLRGDDDEQRTANTAASAG